MWLIFTLEQIMLSIINMIETYLFISQFVRLSNRNKTNYLASITKMLHCFILILHWSNLRDKHVDWFVLGVKFWMSVLFQSFYIGNWQTTFYIWIFRVIQYGWICLIFISRLYWFIERIDEWTICFDALNFYVSLAFNKSYDI